MRVSNDSCNKQPHGILHWRLDVVFRDDASRIRKGNAPAIMTIPMQLKIRQKFSQ